MKYIVLQDFWLRDICLRKGQIITEPVSPRWIDLRLVGFYRDAITDLNDKGVSNEQIDTVNEILDIERLNNSDSVAIVDGTEVKKKRKYTKRKGINYVKPELSEVIVNEIN